MSELVEKYLAENNIEGSLQECLSSGYVYLGIYLGKLLAKTEESRLILQKLEAGKQAIKIFRVQLLCNWCSSEQLARLWNKMSQGGFKWNNLQLVWNDPVDFYVVINKPPEGAVFDKKRTVVFQMEPQMIREVDLWKEWCDPDGKEFLKVCKHQEKEYNNNEWHLSKTYAQLCREIYPKNPEYHNVLSTVLSAKYRDRGHVKRIDFVKFLEKRMTVHVYGDNKWEFKDYKGSLLYHCKDNAIFPYKYTFNAENRDVPYYYTEKLIDGILGESLTFYWGCPNIRELIDPRAYVQLELSNFEQDCEIIQRAIREDWHTQRLPYIRQAKRRILNDLQFFPRLEKIISSAKIE